MHYSTHVFNNALTIPVQPNWTVHGFGWTPEQGYRTGTQGYSQNLSNDALSPALKALQVSSAQYRGCCEFITCDAYENEFQAILQLAVFPQTSLEEALSAVARADTIVLGNMPIDNTAPVDSNTLMTNGIIPMDKIKPYTALRLMQFYIQHLYDTYVIRFNSYIPTPNDSCSYDDKIFFNALSKQAFPQFVLSEIGAA